MEVMDKWGLRAPSSAKMQSIFIAGEEPFIEEYVLFGSDCAAAVRMTTSLSSGCEPGRSLRAGELIRERQERVLIVSLGTSGLTMCSDTERVSSGSIAISGTSWPYSLGFSRSRHSRTDVLDRPSDELSVFVLATRSRGRTALRTPCWGASRFVGRAAACQKYRPARRNGTDQKRERECRIGSAEFSRGERPVAPILKRTVPAGAAARVCRTPVRACRIGAQCWYLSHLFRRHGKRLRKFILVGRRL